MSQYKFLVASAVGATAYSVARRPKNGLGVLLVAGAAGAATDLVYGWNFACQNQVQAWRQYQTAQDEEEQRKLRGEVSSSLSSSSSAKEGS